MFIVNVLWSHVLRISQIFIKLTGNEHSVISIPSQLCIWTFLGGPTDRLRMLFLLYRVFHMFFSMEKVYVNFKCSLNSLQQISSVVRNVSDFFVPLYTEFWSDNYKSLKVITTYKNVECQIWSLCFWVTLMKYALIHAYQPLKMWFPDSRNVKT